MKLPSPLTAKIISALYSNISSSKLDLIIAAGGKTAPYSAALKILNDYAHKIDSKLFDLESKQIQAHQSLKNFKFNHEHITAKSEDFVNEYNEQTND